MTFRYTTIGIDEITSSDLAEEAHQLAAYDATMEAYSITVYDDAGITPEPEGAEALYLPEEGRLGIAWGAPATWADVPSVEQGIEWYLNDGDEWEARN